jgi:ribA/ribD-fused uncharacterized protein
MADKLYFYSGSADKAPGRGSNEHVSVPANYATLASIENWRKMLSNFWVAPILVDDLHWNTIEHYFQSKKIALANPDLANKFCMESETALSISDGSTAQKNRKMVILDATTLAQWDLIKSAVMERALRAKFTQHPVLAAMLQATNEAQLWHSGPRIKPVRMTILETIRSELSG